MSSLVRSLSISSTDLSRGGRSSRFKTFGNILHALLQLAQSDLRLLQALSRLGRRVRSLPHVLHDTAPPQTVPDRRRPWCKDRWRTPVHDEHIRRKAWPVPPPAHCRRAPSAPAGSPSLPASESTAAPPPPGFATEVASHFGGRYLLALAGSSAINRCRACHSMSGCFPASAWRKRL